MIVTMLPYRDGFIMLLIERTFESRYLDMWMYDSSCDHWSARSSVERKLLKASGIL